MCSNDRQKGKAILILTLILFLYYTVWVIGFPFIDDDRFRSLFSFDDKMPLMTPACVGLMFIGGLMIFSAYYVNFCLVVSEREKTK